MTDTVEKVARDYRGSVAARGARAAARDAGDLSPSVARAVDVVAAKVRTRQGEQDDERD